MFSSLKRMIGNVTVEVKDSIVYVEGVPADVISNDIKRIWGTGRINQHMFVTLEPNAFSFYEFFPLDVVYAIETLLDNPHARTSRRTLGRIRDELLAHTWLARRSAPFSSKLNHSVLSKFTLTPLDFQQKFFEAYDNITQQNGLLGYLLAGSAGSGKAQPLDARIKVPGGWSTMGEMSVGTEVIAKDGSTTKVIGVYPQGVKDIYEISFADGRVTECCAEHLWKIIRPHGQQGQHFSEVVSTETLIGYLRDGKYANRIAVELIDPEEGVDADLLLDPYLLGVYLGDGCSRGGTITITTPDEFLVEEVSCLLPPDTKLTTIPKSGDRCLSYRIVGNTNYSNNAVKKALLEYELFDKLSYHKRIPTEYLFGSKRQRLALLQGLMDTDGTCDLMGTSSFCSASLELAIGVQYLVRSLGGIASISKKFPHFTYKGVRKSGALAYQVNIRYKRPSELFRLPKKKSRTNDSGQYCEHLRLRIVDIKFIGSKEAQCISIEHPDRLYVTDDFIVTHNTLSAIVLMEMLEKDTVIVVCPNNALERVWETNLLDKYHNPPSYWIAKSGKPYTGKEKFIVVNYEYLAQLIKDIPKLRLGKIGIVLDESHNFNEVKSLRTELFLELCTITKCEDILWLSGTPIKALGSEAIPLIRCIDPLFTKECEERFKKIFGTSSERATDILNHRLNQLMFKVEKKELKILPPIFKEIKVRVPGSEKYTLDSVRAQMQAFTEERLAYYAERMESDQKTFYACLDEHERTLSTQQERNTYKHYRTCLSATIASGGDARVAKDEIVYCNKYESRTLVPSLSESSKKRFREVKSIVKYVKLKVQGECLGRIVGRARINAHIDMAPYIDYRSVTETTEKKTVVFTSFTEVINVLEKKLPELGFDPLFVYGKTNSQLSAIIRKFDSDKDVNPLVATYASLSTAVPLLSADVMIMIDAPWRDYVLQQTVSRISRLGADTQTYVYTAVLDTGDKPNISTRSFDILKWSQQMVSAITGVTSPFEISDDIEQADMALESFFESEARTDVPNYLSW